MKPLFVTDADGLRRYLPVKEPARYHIPTMPAGTILTICPPVPSRCFVRSLRRIDVAGKSANTVSMIAGKARRVWPDAKAFITIPSKANT